jgi:type II secretory pathway component PulF
MPIFEYQGLDATGKTVKGTVSGASLDLAQQTLLKRGLQVQSVQPVSVNLGQPVQQVSAPGGVAAASNQDQLKPADSRPDAIPYGHQIGVRLFGKVPLPMLGFFFSQAASMLGAGVNPAQSYRTLAGQTTNLILKSVINEIADDAEKGRPMSDAMRRHPEVFNPIYTNLIYAGEQGGFLESALRDCAKYCDEEQEIKSLINRSTLMPKLTLIFSMIIIGGASLIIRLIAPNSPVQISSPLTELSTWIVLGPALIALFVFVRLVLPIPSVKQAMHSIVVTLPAIGPTVREFATAKFGRAFGALYRGGVQVPDGIRLAAGACGNSAMEARILPAAEMMEKGAGITEALQSTGVFNQVVIDMVGTGEMSGQMDQMLMRLSDYYQETAKHRALIMGRVLGIVVLIMVAIYVVIVVVNFFTGYVNGIMRATGN